MKIGIELIVKNYNGGPKIKVFVGDEIMFEGHMKERGRQTIEFEAKSQLPEQITICHYDKNMKKDTKLGHNGVIVDDKAFIIDTVKIDDIKLKYELYLFDFTKVDGTVMKNNNYIGHNGKFVIEEKNIAEGYDIQDLLELVPNAKTMPQIWLDEEHVGGFFELEKKLKD